MKFFKYLNAVLCVLIVSCNSEKGTKITEVVSFGGLVGTIALPANTIAKLYKFRNNSSKTITGIQGTIVVTDNLDNVLQRVDLKSTNSFSKIYSATTYEKGEPFQVKPGQNYTILYFPGIPEAGLPPSCDALTDDYIEKSQDITENDIREGLEISFYPEAISFDDGTLIKSAE